MNRAGETDVPIRAGLFSRGDLRDPAIALRGTRCEACAETFFPPRAVCPRCRSAAGVGTVALSRTGTVYSFTRVVRTPAHLKDPYVLALVDLPEGVRLMAQVATPMGEDVRVGTPVRLAVGPLFDLPDGRHVWGYWFEPAAPGRG